LVEVLKFTILMYERNYGWLKDKILETSHMCWFFII